MSVIGCLIRATSSRCVKAGAAPICSGSIRTNDTERTCSEFLTGPIIPTQLRLAFPILGHWRRQSVCRNCATGVATR